jgi:hypothetical protein
MKTTKSGNWVNDDSGSFYQGRQGQSAYDALAAVEEEDEEDESESPGESLGQIYSEVRVDSMYGDTEFIVEGRLWPFFWY